MIQCLVIISTLFQETALILQLYSELLNNFNSITMLRYIILSDEHWINFFHAPFFANNTSLKYDTCFNLSYIDACLLSSHCVNSSYIRARYKQPKFIIWLHYNHTRNIVQQMGNCLRKVMGIFKGFSAIHRISGKKLREIKHIAEGGYGFVSLVEDTDSGRLFAMKKMICQSAQQRQIYKHEVKVLKQLSHCPHIIGFFGSHEIERQGFLQAYILMQYGQKTVYDLIVESQKKGNNRLSEQQILKITKQTALALQQMHAVGIMHHDVKVENILLSKQGTAKLCDFGSSTRQKIDLSTLPKSKIYKYEQKFQKFTTMMYRPPQMVDVYLKHPVDERVDIWMLGCVLYVLNYKFHPFQDEGKLSIVYASIKYPKTITKKMQKLIRHILTPNPFYRPTLDQIIEIIDNWQVRDFQLNQIASQIEKNEKFLQNEQFSKVENMQWHKMRPESQWNQYQS